MTTWAQYQTLIPTLTRIEEAYAQLEVFERYYRQEDSESHGLTRADIADVKRETIMALRREILGLPAKVYYWLLPFYPGDFLVLLRAIKAMGGYDPEEKSFNAKRDFYQFFLSLPFAERVILGLELGSTDLVQRTSSLLEKIEDKKEEITKQLNQHHGN